MRQQFARRREFVSYDLARCGRINVSDFLNPALSVH